MYWKRERFSVSTSLKIYQKSLRRLILKVLFFNPLDVCCFCHNTSSIGSQCCRMMNHTLNLTGLLCQCLCKYQELLLSFSEIKLTFNFCFSSLTVQEAICREGTCVLGQKCFIVEFDVQVRLKFIYLDCKNNRCILLRFLCAGP